MTDPTFLRLVPAAQPAERAYAESRTAAEAAVIEAALDGLPPGGHVLEVGGDGWLSEALTALGATTARIETADLSAAAGDPLLGLPADGLPPYVEGDVDLAVVPAAALGDAAHALLLAVGDRLAPGGRILIVAEHPSATGTRRKFGPWVRLLAGAGFALCDAIEPDAIPPLLLLVAER